ncbi:MAG: Tat pathway signal protein [Lentisphaerae bacterium]|nr:Tat pathway signal protein [Lentisphaerota bacterium]
MKAILTTLMCLCALSVMAEEPANIAVVAVPSTSYVSGDTSVDALNDDVRPRRSNNRNNGSYGNWPQTGTQWVQYEWSEPISTDAVEVFWWDDRQGVRLPSSARLLYWDGSNFVPVSSEETLSTAADRFNTLQFDAVTTTKLRLEIVGASEYSTGILEWRVLDSGRSPTFPPNVKAEDDRMVMLTGKTYLGGEIKALKGEASVAWSKLSGPGWVTFDDAEKLDATASFSAPGEYVLQLTVSVDGKSGADTLNVKVVEPPPAKNLQPVDTMPYTIDSLLWNARAKAIIVNWIPHCIDKINDPNLPEGGINNFIDAANKLQGKPYEDHRGYVFSNAWIYNTMESICIALMVDPQGDEEIIQAQAKMRRTLDEWIPIVLAAQEPDGYLQTVFTLRDWEHWSDRHRADHEGYVAGYFLEAAVSHYMLTGGEDLRLYNAAKKLADCWVANIGPEPGKKVWYDGHQAMEMALVRFGRFVNTVEGKETGAPYIQLAKFLLDSRTGGSEYDQSHAPVVEQYEAVGHAVRASYTYAGMSDVAMETHDIDYQSAVMSLYDNIINRKYYITGGIGSGETSEGFGPDYSLRHGAYCESCSSCGLIFFEHKLNMAYHDARYADLYEESLYNALLGSLDLEGKNFYYQNPLTQNNARYPWHGCPCCVGNIPRVLLMLPTWTYVKDEDNLYVNMFLGSRITVPDVAGTDIEMVQKTDYPWNGNVSITVNPKKRRKFPLHIRVPNHNVSELYTTEPAANGLLWIKLNGERIQPEIKNGYAVIERRWEEGDTVEFELPMTIQKVRGDERIAATQGEVALRYGPLIYTVESNDQPLNKTLSTTAQLTAQWMPGLLDGIVGIKGKWSDGTDLLAIPYFARANRIGTSSEQNVFGGPGTEGSNAGRPRNPTSSSRVWVEEE